MFARFALALLIATVAVACGHNRRATKTVLDRASFDFHCPREEIELIVIDEEGARNLASQIAAHGCEHQAVYVFFPDVDTWVLSGSVATAPVEHDPAAYHGKRLNRKENKADKKEEKKDKKREKKDEKAQKEIDEEAKVLETPPVD